MAEASAQIYADNSTNVRIAKSSESQTINADLLIKVFEELLDFDDFQLELTWEDVEADLKYGKD